MVEKIVRDILDLSQFAFVGRGFLASLAEWYGSVHTADLSKKPKTTKGPEGPFAIRFPESLL
jgi:hypothetical protein